MSENTHPTIYALVAAIDEYPIARHRLNGCVNDASALVAYLEGNFPCEDLHIKFIKNEEVTRQGLIDAFQHFQQAGEGDVCLLYFSGHGSRVPAPKEFLEFEPDGMLESIVCHDSRLKNGMDLMDKELGYLIYKACAGPQKHFVAIFDCCHSGTNTRAVEDDTITPRMAEPAHSPARAEEFLGFAEFYQRASANQQTPNWNAPKGRHVHLAAARANETAKELRINGQVRGAFTYSLIEVLQRTGGLISYQQLMEHLRTRIKDRVPKQIPQLESISHIADKDLIFLGQKAGPKEFSYAVEQEDGKWYLMAGQVHGLPTDRASEIKIAVQSKGETLFHTQLQTVAFKKSALASTQTLTEGEVYRGVVTQLPIDQFKIAALPASSAQAVASLQKASEELDSLYYTWTNDHEEADYHVHTVDNHLMLTLPGDDHPLFLRVQGYDEGSAIQFLMSAETVARHRFVKHLSNPNTRIQDHEFAIEWHRIKKAGSWEQDDNAEAEEIKDWRQPQVFEYNYSHKKDRWLNPAFRLCLRNTSKRSLYFSAVNLVPQFGIDNHFLAGQWLEPGEEVWLSDTDQGQTYKTIPLSVHPAFTQAGVPEVTEQFKIFISTEEVDTSTFNQDELKMDGKRVRAGRSGLGKVHQRDMGPDWRIVDLYMRIIRPLDEVQIPQGGTAAVAQQIKISLPQGVQAKAALTGMTDAERHLSAIGERSAARLPDQVPGWSVQTFGRGLAQAPAASVLELMEVEGADKINADRPIKIHLADAIADDEVVIPVGYDLETGLLIPLGMMGEDGQFTIDELPAPTPNGTRSLGGSIKIFFQKTVLSKLGEDYDYPQLAIPAFTNLEENLDFTYQKDTATITERVAQAQNILVMTHGIIGDTTEMPKSAYLSKTPDGNPVADQYDLLLTFDYESLNTPIDQTAQKLKEKLAEVGLQEGHGKTVHLVAHSMGGLVSRWMIEKIAGGNEIIQHLFLVGTPNNGSPWSSVYEMASTYLAQAVNGAAFFQPYLIPLRFVGKFLDKMFLCLKQMKAGSDFLKKLNDGTDPGIPYTIVAGNTQLIPAKEYEQQVKLLRRVLRRFRDRGHYKALDMVLFKATNDIAVSVASISEIEGSAKRKKVPEVVTVGCDHISYFASPEGLQVLSKVLS